MAVKTVTPAKVLISVKALIPVVEYGSLTIEASWESEVDESQVDRSATVIEGIKRLQNDMAMALLPLVESEITRAASVLLKDHDPDAFMRRNCKLYNWFKIVNPDVIIPAMQAILASKEIPNRGAVSLKNFDDNAIAQTPVNNVFRGTRQSTRPAHFEFDDGHPEDYGDK